MKKAGSLKYLLVVLVFHVPFTCLAQNLLSGPQKIVIDIKRNRLLVSNFNTGDIVQIDSLGNQTYFIQGADFVDGMEIVGDTVYGIGNNRKISAYDLGTKQQVMNVTLPGSAANYLSSIAYDSAGNLFISSPNLNVIYRMRISDRSFWTFAQDNGLNKPNGILLEKEKNRILVIDDSPNTSMIHSISLADSTVSTIAATSFNRPDGIVKDKYGYYYIGGYYLQGVYRFDPDFTRSPELIINGLNIVYPTYDKSDHSLLLTHYEANTWERVYLATTGINRISQPEEFILYPLSQDSGKSGVNVTFVLSKKSHVRLDVFSATGSLSKTLVNEEREAGRNLTLWNWKDSSGNLVESGMYFFRMTVDGAAQVQRTVFFK